MRRLLKFLVAGLALTLMMSGASCAQPEESSDPSWMMSPDQEDRLNRLMLNWTQQSTKTLSGTEAFSKVQNRTAVLAELGQRYSDLLIVDEQSYWVEEAAIFRAGLSLKNKRKIFDPSEIMPGSYTLASFPAASAARCSSSICRAETF